MKVVILAGGYGTRSREELQLKPKPMIEIGEKPILWHIMKLYSHYGFNEFVICLGYEGYYVKEYFAHYLLHGADVTFDFTGSGAMTVHNRTAEPWKVTLVDTGAETNTGGRVRRIRRYVGDEPFMLTYGDSVGDVDLDALGAFHRSHGRLATITATQPAWRFGALDLGEGDLVCGFREKSRWNHSGVNAGFFVLEPGVFDYIAGDATVWEQESLGALARDGQLAAYRHEGFWQQLDTPRDKHRLERLWQGGAAPWMAWPRGAG
jgi:glucose-1-phosphate cytidylyltransferase